MKQLISSRIVGQQNGISFKRGTAFALREMIQRSQNKKETNVIDSEHSKPSLLELIEGFHKIKNTDKYCSSSNFANFPRIVENIVENPKVSPHLILKLCQIYQENDLADKNYIRALFVAISRNTAKCSPYETYRILRFLLEIGVADESSINNLKIRLMKVYHLMNSFTLSYSIKSICFFEKINIEPEKIASLVSRFVKIWPKKKAKELEIVNIATSARESCIRDETLASRILKETIHLHSMGKISTMNIHLVNECLKSIGFSSRELGDAFLAASIKDKGLVIFS